MKVTISFPTCQETLPSFASWTGHKPGDSRSRRTDQCFSCRDPALFEPNEAIGWSERSFEAGMQLIQRWDVNWCLSRRRVTLLVLRSRSCSSMVHCSSVESWPRGLAVYRPSCLWLSGCSGSMDAGRRASTWHELQSPMEERCCPSWWRSADGAWWSATLNSLRDGCESHDGWPDQPVWTSSAPTVSCWHVQSRCNALHNTYL